MINNSHKKVIGILGGMGPLATADIFKKICLSVDAARDSDHPRVCIDSNSAIPDRTAAIIADGEDPLPEMIKSAERLSGIGADFLLMPCNTAHYFYNALCEHSKIPVLNMIEITKQHLKELGIKKAGLLATRGTISSKVYENAFEGSEIELIIPDEEGKDAVMGVIYDGIKAGNFDYSPESFKKTCESLLDKGAETLILACTELPPAFELYNLDYPAVDPTLLLAKAAVKESGCKVK